VDAFLEKTKGGRSSGGLQFPVAGRFLIADLAERDERRGVLSRHAGEELTEGVVLDAGRLFNGDFLSDVVERGLDRVLGW